MPNKIQNGIHSMLGTDSYIQQLIHRGEAAPLKVLNHEDYNLAEYRAWWSGDPWVIDRFFKVIPPPAEAFVGGSSDRRASISSEYFWRKAPTGQGVIKAHLPVASSISNTMSRIVFDSGFDILARPSVQKRLWEILKENNYFQKFIAGEEYASFSGHVAYKMIVDRDLSPYPLFIPYAADQIKIGKKHGITTYICFYDYYQKEDKTFKLESEYGKGYIKYTLYAEGKKGGWNEVDLTECEQTEDLKTIAFTMPDGSPVPIIFAVEKPNKVVNNTFDNSAFGSSDFAGLNSEFHIFDEIMSSWALAFRENKTRTFVDERLLPRTPSGQVIQPQFFDTNIKVIGNVLGAIGENDKPIFETQNANFNSDLYTKAMNDLWELVLSRVGLSPYTVGITTNLASNLSGESVRSRERATLRTRQSKVEGWTTLLESMLERLLILHDIMNNAVFIDTVDYLDAQLVAEPNRYDVRLEFNQYIEDSREAMVDMLGKAISNKLMSIEEAVAQFYPERDEEERAVIVRDIKLQNAASMGTSMEMMLAMEVPNGIQERQTETTEEVEDPNNVSQL
jgi:hypothetical protein